MIIIQLNIVQIIKYRKSYRYSVVITDAQIDNARIDLFSFWVNEMMDEAEYKLKIDFSQNKYGAFSFVHDNKPGVWYWFKIFRDE